MWLASQLTVDVSTVRTINHIQTSCCRVACGVNLLHAFFVQVTFFNNEVVFSCYLLTTVLCDIDSPDLTIVGSYSSTAVVWYVQLNPKLFTFLLVCWFLATWIKTLLNTHIFPFFFERLTTSNFNGERRNRRRLETPQIIQINKEQPQATCTSSTVTKHALIN